MSKSDQREPDPYFDLNNPWFQQDYPYHGLENPWYQQDHPYAFGDKGLDIWKTQEEYDNRNSK